MLGMDQPLVHSDGRDIGGFPVLHGYQSTAAHAAPPGSYPPALPHRSGGPYMAPGSGLPGSWGGLPSYPYTPFAAPPSSSQTTVSPEMHDVNAGAKVGWVADAAPVSPPPQRERFSYTRYQLELMNNIYKHIRYPNSMQKQLIAKRVGITRDQVKIWFQNKRRKEVVAKNDPTKAASKSAYPNPIVEGEPPIKMVPEGILTGIIKELLKYENDPKGKKVQKAIEASQKAAAAKYRMIQEEKRVEDTSNNSRDSAADQSFQSATTNVSPVASLVDSAVSAQENRHRTSFNSPESSECSLSLDQNTSIRSAHSLSFSSPESHTAETSRAMTTDEAAEAAKVMLSQPAKVPTSDELDMVAPPNTVVPNCNTGMSLKRPRSVESVEDDVDEVKIKSPKQSRVEQAPPNKVAPPSAPLDFKHTMPLNVLIPGENTSTSQTTIPSCHASTVNHQSPQNSLLGISYGHLWNSMQLPTKPAQNTASQYEEMTSSKDSSASLQHSSQTDQRSSQNAFSVPLSRPVTREDGFSRQNDTLTNWHQPQCDPTRLLNPSSSDVDPCKVFPFPIIAEPSRLLSSMPSYHDAYPGQAMSSYLDTYSPHHAHQPAMITSYSNPYYNYEASLWSNSQDRNKPN